MTSFLDQYKNFVLKLKIKTANGQSQIRRVGLPRIANADGTNVSYEELIDLVIVFSLPEVESSNQDSGKHSVSLTYYDDEKDLITLASTEELMDAIELFGEQKFIRITTSVKPKGSSPAPSSWTSSAQVHARDAATMSFSRGRAVGEEDEDLAPPPVKTILTTFAGILSKAANELPECLASQAKSRMRKEAETPSPTAPTDSKPDADEAQARVSDSCDRKQPPKTKSSMSSRMRQRKATKAGKEDERSNATPLRRNVSSSPNAKPSAKAANEAKSNDNKGRSGSLGKAKKSKDASKQPFIHGRHTCDGCLATPIVGKRYRAKNIPDWDLCQFCFDNYLGDDIHFEAVTLACDIHMQTRWHRKYQQIVAEMKFRSLYGPRHSRSRGSQTGIDAGRRGQSQVESSPSPHPVSGEPTAFRDVGTDPVAPLANADASKEYENSLNEAIRRSLEDIVPEANPSSNRNAEDNGVETVAHSEKSRSTGKESAKSRSTGKESAVKESPVVDQGPKNESSVSMGGATTSEVEMKELKTAAEEGVVKDESTGNATKCVVKDEGAGTGESEAKDDSKLAPVKFLEHEVTKDERAPSDQSGHTKSIAEDEDAEKSCGATSVNIPRSVEILDKKTTEEDGDDCDESTLDNPCENCERKIAESLERGMDTDSVDSEKLLIEANGLPSGIDQTLKGKESETPRSKQSSFRHLQDESFASDAIGNGDVAEDMGKTFDLVAGVISEILAEYDEQKPVIREMTEMLSESDEQKPSSAESSSEMDLEREKGELIVNSNDDTSEAIEEEDDTDWSVVKSVGTTDTTESQKIGQATQMLGSALFNSDLQTSQNGTSGMVSSSSFSIPSSVPTELGTVNSSFVRPYHYIRWATELEKLRELGFNNEEKCIQILEMLDAASELKSDSNGISSNVSRVLTELLELKDE